jgi:hypothetical protein
MSSAEAAYVRRGFVFEAACVVSGPILAGPDEQDNGQCIASSPRELRGLQPDFEDGLMSKQTTVDSGTTTEAIADVVVSMERYRVASAEVGASFSATLKQSEAALTRSYLLLTRIERRTETALLVNLGLRGSKGSHG